MAELTSCCRGAGESEQPREVVRALRGRRPGRRCGFREVGVYERHGRLDGHWKDLLIVERLLSGAA